jgi:hypothetical protein
VGIAIDLVSGYVECLLLLLAFAAARRGRRLYWVAFAGLALVLYSRMVSGLLPGDLAILSLRVTTTAFLAVLGLAVAALTVLVDLLFEVVDEPREAPNPSV